MPRRRDWILLVLALLARVLLQGWDSGLVSPHPDERQVAFVAAEMPSWFADPGFYAYGSLHFEGIRAAAAALGLPRVYHGLILGGRSLSLLASMVALALCWGLARWAWGRRAATLALALAAMVPLDLQLSHFATVEAHHAAWVVAALAACCWLAWRGSTGAALATGAAWGASLAVKVASLPLALPIAAALLALATRRGRIRALRQAAAVAAAAAAVFWLGQPSAFAGGWPPAALLACLAAAAVCLGGLQRGPAGHRRAWAVAAAVTAAVAAGVAAASWTDVPVLSAVAAPLAPAYLHGVGEQLAMVRGAADLPYTRVYAHTLPLLYPTRQLAAWGWGPALLLAAVCGAGRAARRILARLPRPRWSRSSVLLLVLLSWTLPVALRLATLEVKYLRYWEPLGVPAVLLATWGVVTLPRRWRRPAAAVAVAGTALWAVAYLWAFAEPHPHRVAADWLAPMLEPGQTIAFEHWDESLPVAAPGVAAIQLPSYDLPDDEDKVRRWATVLRQADWVVLTSNRVRRTVLANPGRFPRTAQLYRLLLAGEAGLRPLARVDRAPRMLGLAAPVQRADESFVNYDFPRVVVLRRVAATRVEELVQRTAQPPPPALASEVRDLVSSLPEVPPVPSRARQAWLVVVWVALLAGAGGALWVLLLPLTRHLPDAGWGIALASGWIVPGWAAWLGCRLGLWPAGATTSTVVILALLAGAGVVGWRRRGALQRVWHRRRSWITAVATVAGGVLLLFLAIRASNPAIFWGEKPMDSTFLRAFLRAETWPPGEPWMAGEPLHYYSLGEVLAAVPILATDSGGGVGYNLMAATIPALAAAVLASLSLALARRPRLAGVGALPLLALLSGNLAWPFLLDLAREHRLFDLWWATSRVIPGFAIDEYPLWTALFADLHAHFLALPVLLAAAAWGWLAISLGGRKGWAAAAACGVAAGVLAGTNPWDMPVLTGVLAVVAFLSPRPTAALSRLAGAAVVSALAALPFLLELGSWATAGVAGGGLSLNRDGFAPWWALLEHLGLFLLPLAVLAGLVLRRRLLVVAPAAVLAGTTAYILLPSSAGAVAVGLAVLFAAALVGDRSGAAVRTGWGLALLATVLVATCERITVVDRMNTLFKTYNGLWLVLAVALGIQLLRRRGRARTALVAVWAPLELVAVLNLPLGVAQGWLQPRIPSPRPTLDGTAFLPATDPQTWFLVRAIDGMARPGDVLAEAAGDPYGEYGRVTMHTGVPTVLGWPWHLQQRGQPAAAIEVRSTALEALYAGRDPTLRRRVLDTYGVSWVVLADVERRRYGLGPGDDLATVPGVVPVASHLGADLHLVLDGAPP